MGGFISLVLVLLTTGGLGEADFGVSSGTIAFELQCADWLSLTSTGIERVAGFSVGFKNFWFRQRTWLSASVFTKINRICQTTS